MLIPCTSKVVSFGDLYGRYTILGVFKEEGSYQKLARVQCSCGSPPRYIQVGILRNGSSMSCGCLHKERVSKHGLWKDPIFTVWRSMINRCTNDKNKSYKRYGGRGIAVCDRWANPAAFVEDMSNGYEPGLQLDRIDNDKNYSPDNCRWATTKIQTRNYSKNVVIEYEGKKLCLADWSISTGINYMTLWSRVKQGWSIKRTFTTPPKSKKKVLQIANS